MTDKSGALPLRGRATHERSRVAPSPPSVSVPNAGPYSIGSKIWPGTSKVIEECGELLEVAGKLMGSGGDTAHWTGDLRSRLLDELADASAAIHFFASVNLTAEEWTVFERRNGVKGNTFFRWHVENGGGTRRFDANADRPTKLQTARAEGSRIAEVGRLTERVRELSGLVEKLQAGNRARRLQRRV